MKQILLSLLTVASASTFAGSINLDNLQNKQNCNQIINKGIYQVCYNYEYKGATSVSYTVDGTKLTDAEVHIKKRPPFYPENSIPVKYRSFPSDYTKTGYDRGHMANHADFDYSSDLIYQTYSMANIVPQNPTLNRKTWLKAETYERMTARQLGSVNVINLIYYPQNPEKIGKSQVSVPSSFIKVIYNSDKGFKKCFEYQNDEPSAFDNLRQHEVNCPNI